MAWAQFDQLLTCAICLDRYRNPKLLPCQHTFCMEPCLDGLIDYVRRQIKCPECRAEHRIPYKGIQEFPTNVTLMRFLELHREVTGEEPEPEPCLMERCAVCTEKAFCVKCAHCAKKVCEECKEAHIDIMKREINRINNQMPSVSHKNSQAIGLNTCNLKDEIEDLAKRLEKDLKEREKCLITEIDDFHTSEEKSIRLMKENLELEITNINSNCELCDKHITDDMEWTDVELVQYKECFLKMLEFLRNFDIETVDAGNRRLKLIYKMDPHLLHQNVKAFAEIKTNDPNTQVNANQTTLQVPGNAPGQSGGSNALMRSQSDHRLAAQFQRSQKSDSARSMLDVSQKYGPNDSDRDKESPLSSKRGTYGTDSGSKYSRYGERSSTRDLDDNIYGIRNWRDRDKDEEVVTLRESFRQRYGLDPPSDPHDSESSIQSRTVRFAQDEAPQPPIERLFDCEAAKGPISGIVKFVDCPKFQERLHLKEKKTKVDEANRVKKEAEEKLRPPPQPVFKRPQTNRQTSEDEIEKQKKQNKEAAASGNVPSTPPATAPLSRRVSSLQKEDESKSRRSQDDSESDRDSITRRPKSDDSANDTSSRRSSRDDTAGGRVSPAESTGSSRQGTTTRRKTFTRPGHSRTPSATGTYSPINENGRSSESEAELEQFGVKENRKAKDQSSQQKRRSGNFSRTSSNSSLNLNASQDEDRASSPTLASPFFRRSKGSTTVTPPPARISDHTNPLSSAIGTSSTTLPESYRSKSLTKAQSFDHPDESSASSFRSKFSSLGRAPSTDSNKSSNYDRPSQSSFTSRFLPRQATVDDKTESESETETEESDSDDESKVSTIRRKRPDTNPALSALLVRSANARSNATPEDQDKSKSYTSRFQSAYARNKEKTERPSSSQGNYRNYGEDESRHLDDDYLGRYGSGSGSGASRSRSRYGTSNKSNEEDTPTPYNRYRKNSRFSSIRNRIGRSKSSHDIWAEDSAEDDYKSPRRSSTTYRRSSEKSVDASGLSRSGSSHSLKKSRENSIDEEDSTKTTTSSPWAKYLRNKYGSQRSSSGGSVSRSKSSSAIYSQDNSDDEDTVGRSRRGSLYQKDNVTSLSYGRISENPRTMYLQKRRMLMKIGSRGSDKGYFTWPRGVAVGPDNTVVVADSSNHRVQIFDSNGRFMKEFGKYGSAEGEFDCLAGVAVNRIGQFIISDRYNHRVQVFDPSGRFLRSFGCEGRADGRFSYPWGIATDSLGFIYVCDKENHRVQVFQADGTFVGKFGTIGNRPGQLEHPHYIAVSSTNRVIVSDSNNHRLQIFDVNGRCLTSFGGEGSEEGQFKFPRGVAVDDQGYIFVGDSGNNRIQIFHPDGTFLKSFGCWGSGDGEFKGLEGLAVMPNGSIFVCDRENHRIQMF
ncbi:RING finger protein nhl-1 [Nymphon striatum]|nr:RING finger protein nhl-1 [Nymphon striatum]